MEDEDYTPAIRPEGEVGDRIRFEREGQYEQSIGGGSAKDVAQSIFYTTGRNMQAMGWYIRGIEDVVSDLGRGDLQRLSFELVLGDERKTMTITGIALEVTFE